MELPSDNVEDRVYVLARDGGLDGKEARVEVRGVECHDGFDPVELVQDVRVKSTVHSLS